MKTIIFLYALILPGCYSSYTVELPEMTLVDAGEAAGGDAGTGADASFSLSFEDASMPVFMDTGSDASLDAGADAGQLSVDAGSPALGINCSTIQQPDSSCAGRPMGYVCRPSGGPCDGSEVCDGISDRCPEDRAVSAGEPCCFNGMCDGFVCRL